MAKWEIGVKLDPSAAAAPDKPGHLRTTSKWRKDGSLYTDLPVSISKSTDTISFVFYGPELASGATFTFRWIKSPFTENQEDASPFSWSLDDGGQYETTQPKGGWDAPHYKWGGTDGFKPDNTGVYMFTVDVDTPARAGGAKYWVDPEMIIDT